MTNLTSVKVLVLGSKKVGKSAVIVRYLTKRYIGEYRSNSDWMYKQAITCDDAATNVEIFDLSRWSEEDYFPVEQIRWADAVVVVYSICERYSFNYALQCLEAVHKVKAPSYIPIVLLGNKRDLEHGREVSVDEGHELSLQLGCQFYEVSAAESYVGVNLAIHSLIREARTLQLQRTLPRHRKLSIITVSKVFGAVFGKNNAKTTARKRRTSFSL